ncbi:MAG: hypothetical protein KGI00_00960 [Candidatus Micrarchaeota archaeon]|nr:hypothetical protein [Candidatus Micrarchaeota archaeon]MDE1824608.1 hypothetical protein [Candidatus Micrarchaeota archaeon]MDE1849279.1 hypothetical protein [Candidatus Micrarchaeota archaeon]
MVVEQRPIIIATEKRIFAILRPPASFEERVDRHRKLLAEQYPRASPKVVDMSAKNLARLDERISKLENAGGHVADADRNLWCEYTAAVAESHRSSVEGDVRHLLRIV